MKIEGPQTGKLQDRYFTGEVRLSPLLESDDEAPHKLYRVEFAAKARTNWHTHDGVQTLYVESGQCRVQKEGEPYHDLPPGSTAVIPAGEKHWHGADPHGPMVHLAVGLYQKTEWLEPVEDKNYGGEAE